MSSSSPPRATSPPPCSKPRAAERRRGPLGAAALLLLCGCSSFDVGSALDAAVKKVFTPRRTPQQQMLIAVSSEDADLRRDAVVKLAESRKCSEDWAVRGMMTIAALESEPHTRCAAIRGLVRSGDPRALETVLRILNHADYPPQEIRPPDDVARWEAASALADLCAAGVVPAEQTDRVRATLIACLKYEGERHVRIAGARGLAHHPHDESVRALIDGLGDADFAVVHECENALVRLTGQTWSCSPTAWSAWYAEHGADAFAGAGQVPDSRRAPYSNRWQKALYEARLLMDWLFPPRK